MLDQNISNSIKSIKETIDYGFNWPNYKDIIKQILSELDEIKEVIEERQSKSRLKSEIGDLIHASTTLTICFALDNHLNSSELLKFEDNINQYDSLKLIEEIRNSANEIYNIDSIEDNISNKIANIFNITNKLCNINKINTSEIIKEADEKFQARFKEVQKIVKIEYKSQNMKNMAYEVKIQIWKQAKLVDNCALVR